MAVAFFKLHFAYEFQAAASSLKQDFRFKRSYSIFREKDALIEFDEAVFISKISGERINFVIAAPECSKTASLRNRLDIDVCKIRF